MGHKFLPPKLSSRWYCTSTEIVMCVGVLTKQTHTLPFVGCILSRSFKLWYVTIRNICSFIYIYLRHWTPYIVVSFCRFYRESVVLQHVCITCSHQATLYWKLPIVHLPSWQNVFTFAFIPCPSSSIIHCCLFVCQPSNYLESAVKESSAK